MRSDRERLEDILQAVERIEEQASKGKKSFLEDELVQVWMIHHLQIIGEAVARISHKTKNDHPDIPWKQISGMRNILVHDYFGIDIQIVWGVIEKDIGSLKRTIVSALEKMD